MPDSDEKNPADETLIRCYDMWRRTGILHELQALNLRVWPLGLYDEARKVTVSIDQDTHVVSFDLEMKPRRRLAKKTAKARAKLLHEWVGVLIGKDYSLRLLAKGTAIFTLARPEPVSTEIHEGTDFEAGREVAKKIWKPKTS